MTRESSRIATTEDFSQALVLVRPDGALELVGAEGDPSARWYGVLLFWQPGGFQAVRRMGPGVTFVATLEGDDPFTEPAPSPGSRTRVSAASMPACTARVSRSTGPWLGRVE